MRREGGGEIGEGPSRLIAETPWRMSAGRGGGPSVGEDPDGLLRITARKRRNDESGEENWEGEEGGMLEEGRKAGEKVEKEG